METDRFRKRLSLLGVAVGIYSIVTALSLVDCLQASVQEGFAAYGGDILFVDREPFEPDLNEDGVFRWWNYAGRPAVTWQEYRYLSESFPESAFLAYGLSTVGVDGSWPLLVNHPLAEGRGLTAGELADGAARCLAGSETEARSGDSRWIDGVRYEVIGVFEKAGMTTVSPVDIDHVLLVPYKSMKGPVLRSSIAVAEADANSVRERMRNYRRLSPLDADNFAINRMSFLRDEMDEIFKLVARLGWLVGIFSLLAGGIGMANMLYVAVEERKAEIGRRKKERHFPTVPHRSSRAIIAWRMRWHSYGHNYDSFRQPVRNAIENLNNTYSGAFRNNSLPDNRTHLRLRTGKSSGYAESSRSITDRKLKKRRVAVKGHPLFYTY